MNVNVNDQLFKKCEKLIYNRAWYYAKAYQMDFEDLKSEAFLIFCEAIQRFDATKGASFPTFLFHRLKTLNDYCLSHTDDHFEPLHDELESYSPASRILFHELSLQLSEDGRKVLEGLIHGSFHNPTQERMRTIGKGRIHEICSKEWGWSGSRAEAVWNELCAWWGENEVLLACE